MQGVSAAYRDRDVEPEPEGDGDCSMKRPVLAEVVTARATAVSPASPALRRALRMRCRNEIASPSVPGSSGSGLRPSLTL